MVWRPRFLRIRITTSIRAKKDQNCQQDPQQRTGGPLLHTEGDGFPVGGEQQIAAVHGAVLLFPAAFRLDPEVIALAVLREPVVDRVGDSGHIRIVHRDGNGGAGAGRALRICPGDRFRSVADGGLAAEAAIHQDLGKGLGVIRQEEV